MALLSSLVAKIETPIDKGKKIGTAYPVSDGYIITAYHVFPDIENFGNTKIYWYRNDDSKSGEILDEGISISEIVYKNKKYDIVIAKCRTPKHTNSVHWSSSDLVTGNWTSIGYAKSGKDPNNKIRLKNPAGGSIFQMLDDDWILQLESKGNASDVELWRGMSGAPVFIEGTNTLLAIIINTPPKYKSDNSDDKNNPVHKNRLYAASIPYLLKNCSKFKQAISFKNDVAVFLENAATLVEQKGLIGLFNQHEKDIPDESLDMCRYLSHLTLPDFLRIIATLQKKNKTKKSALGQLVCTLLPHLFDDEKAIEIREGLGDISCPLVAVPYSSPVSVEMLMAKADYRPAEIEKFTQDDFTAKYRLPLPPESGDEGKFNEGICLDAYHSFAGEQQQLVVETITRTLFSREVERGVLADPSIHEQDKVDYVKDALRDRAIDQENSYYFIIDENAVGGKDQIEKFSSALKAIYPHCTVIHCVANKEVKRTELSEYRKLRTVLEPYLTADNE